MDLNYLYKRRQISLMRADSAACRASEKAHRGLAHLYDAEIVAQRATWRARPRRSGSEPI